MKKTVILIMISVLVCSILSAYSLGIKARYINTGISGFNNGMKVTYIYDNSIASRFLKVGDVIIAASSYTSWGPTNQRSKGVKVSGNYVYNQSDFKDNSIHSESSFKSVVSQIGGSGSVSFLVYRNGQYIEYILN